MNRGAAASPVPLTCRACGGDDLDDFGACRPFADAACKAMLVSTAVTTPEGRLYRCPRCFLGQRIPIPDVAVVEAMYRELPEGGLQYQVDLNTAWALARDVLELDLSRFPAPAILDVGCYDGQFLRSVPPAWRRFGLEPSRRAADVARQAGVEILGPSLRALDQHRNFDAVCLFDVLEHVRNPAEELRLALMALKPGGLLIASTADMDSWTWRWAATTHWYLETPQHVSFASRRFFRWFAAQAGAPIERSARIPHQRGGWSQRLDDAVNVFYFGSIGRREHWRLARGLIRRIPRWRGFVHTSNMATASRLRDHVIVVMRRPTLGAQTGGVVAQETGL